MSPVSFGWELCIEFSKLNHLFYNLDITDHQSLLFKDAVYDAIGLGVNSLYGRLDFEPFVMNRLVVELRNKVPNFKILRRRIGWMLGKWVTEGISSDCRKVIYEILLELMSEEEDLVVRLTAANGLKQAVDDWDFDIDIVLPYLGRAMSLLLSLLNEVEESDTTMKLISYLTAIMDRTSINVHISTRYAYICICLHVLNIDDSLCCTNYSTIDTFMGPNNRTFTSILSSCYIHQDH